MRTIISSKRTLGMSLVELMVSVGLMSFIFASMAFMVFYTGRNSLIVREQARSQTEAGMASERITNMLRGASGFRPYTGDMSTTKTEVLFDMPNPAGGTQTGIVTYKAASSVNESDGIVKIYEDVADFEADAAPDWEYPFIQDFKVIFNTSTWITIVVSYSYRGFTLSEYDSADADEVHDSRLSGEFVTDVIAKNHHPGESAHYAETTNTLFYFKHTSRGSALVGSLVMLAILALVVGVMLSSSNRTIRQSRDRIMYEEAYQAAVSGTHVARAWMIDPGLAGDMSPASGIDASLKALMEKAKTMNEGIILNKEAGNYSNLYNTTRFSNAGIELGEELPDGRVVVYNFPDDRPIVSFDNDDGNAQFSYNVFKDTPAKGHRNYVESVRLTTPGFKEGSPTSCSLREATFIIEARGVAEYAGTKKERVVLQRVLIYPNEPGAPLLSASEAILTQGSFSTKESSSGNVHWAPVLSKFDIYNEFVEPILAPKQDGKPWVLTTVNGVGNKFNGAGLLTSETGNNSGINPMDEWLRWMAGSEGHLIGNKGVGLFDNIQSTIGTIEVTDFFKQLYAGDFNSGAKPLNKDLLNFGGLYQSAGTSLDTPNGIYTTNAYGDIEGAFVQGSIEVDERIDEWFDTYSYDELKAYAKAHDGYYVYDNGQLYDATGRPATLPDMVELLPEGEVFDPLVHTDVSDRILFIDSKNSNSDPGDLLQNEPFTENITLPSFWKGVMYVNGPVTARGAGSSPSMKIRTPKEFTRARQGLDNKSYTADAVFMDGILVCNGFADLGANGVVYGTLAAKTGVQIGATGSVYYNAANSEGRLKDDEDSVADFRLIAGRLTETTR